MKGTLGTSAGPSWPEVLGPPVGPPALALPLGQQLHGPHSSSGGGLRAKGQAHRGRLPGGGGDRWGSPNWAP